MLCQAPARQKTKLAPSLGREKKGGGGGVERERSCWFRDYTLHPQASPSKKKAHESGQPYGIVNEGSENEPHALKENKRKNILNAITLTEAAWHSYCIFPPPNSVD